MPRHQDASHHFVKICIFTEYYLVAASGIKPRKESQAPVGIIEDGHHGMSGHLNLHQNILVAAYGIKS